MPKAKSGTPGNAMEPPAPEPTNEADKADPGEAAKIKLEQIQKEEGKHGSVKAKPHKPPKTEEEKQEEEKTSWIEIELVGEDDEPIPGTPFKVTLPDGAVAQHTLDQNGWARVDGFNAGQCKITFPELDKGAWEFIESVGPKPQETD